jgi:hypothetical protein
MPLNHYIVIAYGYYASAFSFRPACLSWRSSLVGLSWQIKLL